MRPAVDLLPVAPGGQRVASTKGSAKQNVMGDIFGFNDAVIPEGRFPCSGLFFDVTVAHWSRDKSV